MEYYSTIDEFLGSRESRYFGNGYVNTAQVLSDFALIGDSDEIEFSCSGAVLLSDLWSVKSSGKQRPHLSSIDAIEFAVECLRVISLRAYPDNEFSIESIQRLDVFAGKEPTEERLDSVPLTGRFKKGLAGTDVLKMSISNMKVNVQFSANNSKNTLSTRHEKHPALVNDLLLNRESLMVSAIASPVTQSPTESWSLSTCFAVALQLGQTLLYKHDGISRENSNTLWMRKISIDISSGMPSLRMPQPVYAKLNNVKGLVMAGSTWRCADIFSIMCNTNIVCSVAHKI
jgi:hypothetical protein